MTRIELAYLAWEASALPLSYIGTTPLGISSESNQVIFGVNLRCRGQAGQGGYANKTSFHL
jgi:hypothetical protein